MYDRAKSDALGLLRTAVRTKTNADPTHARNTRNGRYRANAFAERAKRRWPAASDTSSYGSRRKGANSSSSNDVAVGPRRPRSVTSGSVAGSYYLVGGGDGGGGSSATRRSSGGGSRASDNVPVAFGKRSYSSGAGGSPSGAVVRNGLLSLQEEDAEGHGGKDKPRYGEGKGDGEVASEVGVSHLSTTPLHHDGERPRSSGNDRSVLGHAQAAELTRVQDLLSAAQADNDDCVRRAEHAEAESSRLRLELDHLRRALAAQAPPTSRREEDDPGGATSGTELPVLNDTLQRYVMALRLAIGGVKPENEVGGNCRDRDWDGGGLGAGVGPTLLDEELNTAAQERVWYHQERNQLVRDFHGLQSRLGLNPLPYDEFGSLLEGGSQSLQAPSPQGFTQTQLRRNVVHQRQPHSYAYQQQQQEYQQHAPQQQQQNTNRYGTGSGGRGSEAYDTGIT